MKNKIFKFLNVIVLLSGLSLIFSCSNDDDGPGSEKDIKLSYDTFFSKGDKIAYRLIFANSSNPIDYNDDGVLITDIRNKGMRACEWDNNLMFKREGNQFSYYYYDAGSKCDEDYSSKGTFRITDDTIILIDENNEIYAEFDNVKISEKNLQSTGKILSLDYTIPYYNIKGEQEATIKYTWNQDPNVYPNF